MARRIGHGRYTRSQQYAVQTGLGRNWWADQQYHEGRMSALQTIRIPEIRERFGSLQETAKAFAMALDKTRSHYSAYWLAGAESVITMCLRAEALRTADPHPGREAVRERPEFPVYYDAQGREHAEF